MGKIEQFKVHWELFSRQNFPHVNQADQLLFNKVRTIDPFTTTSVYFLFMPPRGQPSGQAETGFQDSGLDPLAFIPYSFGVSSHWRRIMGVNSTTISQMPYIQVARLAHHVIHSQSVHSLRHEVYLYLRSIVCCATLNSRPSHTDEVGHFFGDVEQNVNS